MAGTNKLARGLRDVPINVTAGGCSQTLPYTWAMAVPVWGPQDTTPRL